MGRVCAAKIVNPAPVRLKVATPEKRVLDRLESKTKNSSVRGRRSFLLKQGAKAKLLFLQLTQEA